MSKLSQAEYHAMRSRNERALAASAASIFVRAIHLELAECHGRLSLAVEEQELDHQRQALARVEERRAAVC